MNTDIEILYEKSVSGADNCFKLKNDLSFLPPAENFISYLNDEEKKIFDLIWYLSLFHKYGLLRTAIMRNGTGMWTSHYDFEIDSIHGILVYDDEYEMISNFSVTSGDPDERKRLAESLRDLIVNEGKNVSYNDWLRLKKDL